MSVAEVILLLVKISVVFSVFAIGLKATFADAVHLIRRPGQLFRALLAMNVLMPVFAISVALNFNLPPPVKLALVVLSVSPIPPILPKTAMQSGGRGNYTIGLLVAISVLSIIVIPITLECLEWLSGVPLSARPGEVFVTILITVLAPLLVGIVCRLLSSSIADRAAKSVALIAMIALVLCFLPILFTSRRAFMTLIGDGTLLALSSFAIVGMIVGHLLGGPSPDNRPVLALATARRHPAVAMAIAHASFPNQKLATAVVLMYLVISIILAIPYLQWIKRAQLSHAHGEKQVPV